MNTAAFSCRARFSKGAKNYAQESHSQARIANSVLEMLPISPPPVSILEIGAGTGFLTSGLLRRFPAAAITACDFSRGMLEELRRTIRDDVRVQLIECDMDDLPGLQERFDLVVSSSTLQWASDLPATLSRLGSLVVEGGAIAVSTMVDGTLRELRNLRLELYPHLAPGRALPTGKEVREALKRAGFRVNKEREVVETEFDPGAWALMARLSATGLTGGALSRGSRLLRRGELLRLAAEYDARYCAENLGVRSTYQAQLLYGTKR